MDLLCPSLVTNDAEHPFMCLLSIGVSLLEKCLFNPLPIFYITGLSFYY